MFTLKLSLKQKSLKIIDGKDIMDGSRCTWQITEESKEKCIRISS